MPQNISMKKLIMLTGDLPPISIVARKVMEVVNYSSTNAETLQQIISKDQGMAGHIMKIANSALYASSGKIETLTDAIVMLGFNSIRSLSIMSATKNLYKLSRNGGRIGLKDKLMWEHSVAAAIAGRIIARKVKPSYAEHAFMGGLMHDIGKLVLLKKVPDRFDHVIEEVYNTGRHFQDVEMEEFGFEHSEVGALLIKKWRLPEDFEEAIMLHHKVVAGMEIDNQLVYYIDLANKFCHKLGIGFTKEPELEIQEEISALMLGLSKNDIDELKDSIKRVCNDEMHVFL